MEKGDRVKVVKVDGGAPDGLVGKTGVITSASPDGLDVRFEVADLPADAGWVRTWSFELDDVRPA